MTRDIQYLGTAEISREEALRVPAYAKKFLAEYDRLTAENEQLKEKCKRLERHIRAINTAVEELGYYQP